MVLIIIGQKPDITANKLRKKTGSSTRKISRIIKKYDKQEK